jgi:hypothetical protein
MANNYSDSTGILIFGAGGGVTPIIATLFAVYEVLPTFPTDQVMIKAMSESSSTDWGNVTDHLIEYAEELDIALADRDNLAQILIDIGVHHGVTCEKYRVLAAQADRESAGGTGDADLGTLFDLADMLDDGHHLEAIRWEGAWHCDKPRLFEFGGYGRFDSNRVSMNENSSFISGFGENLHQALNARDMEQAAKLVLSRTREVFDAILDEADRAELLRTVMQQMTAKKPVPVPA